ncbi:phosphatidylinositol-specific phospholipase C [Providencia vermicola]|uniref:phosphatidylinositol-specific phospholipase C n=1 Tax=Providencia TaxID=586 RepID=UPI0023492BDA|nr:MULTISPECIES: phosphatidylinositol-specific phospholipase C [unclassified Providencia]ELR5141645.1 phosphatidylinositol-specific phospholipase C [Providencia stuartii]WER20428.1 phosphatidylinositol-specific phospholipase C [Providencia stuartii]WER24546.1 phosphatidylinositol-specific phospholipase C [Providencia stuartii]WER28637.1 phosphatidylinositol-specific phospholipase C [Providencia stuartii]
MLKIFFYILIMSFCTTSHAHWDSAYFRKASDGFTSKSKWMSSIRDDVLLSEIAIPGTHDSAAYKGFVDSVATQTLNFDQQLEYGIRMFDIRVRHTSDRFALHHGTVFLDVMFGDFLNSVDRFLEKNPSETVIFRLKEEMKPNNNNTRSMSETLEYYISLHKDKYVKLTSLNTRLAEVRGKFAILSDGREFWDYGVSYWQANIQDEYHLKTNWDLYTKWEHVKEQLATATRGSSRTTYINYLSGSGGSFPYFVASGHSSPGTSAPRLSTGLTTPGWKYSYPDFPRVSCFIGICTIAFEGTNILTRDKINQYNRLGVNRTVGIIIADFPGESLISSIIANNKNLQK